MSELPPGWARTTVGEIATLTDGPFGSNLKTSHYVDSGPRVVRLQNIGDGFFRDEHAHITAKHFDTLVKHEVRAGDIVAASLGDDPPRACIVPGWLGRAIVKADCIRIRAAEGVEPGFLMWMLNSRPVRAQAATRVKGIGRPRLGLGGLRALAIPMPPLNEQRRIVAAIEEHLSRLDAADASLAAALRRLEVLRRSALAAAMNGGWTRRPLGEVADTQLGKMLSQNAKTGVGSRPYLRNKNVQWGRIDTDDLLTMDFSDREAEKFGLTPGDVLVCEGGEVGRAAVWRGQVEGCCFQKALHRVRSNGEVEPEFIAYVFRWLSDTSAFDPHVTGSTIKHLPQEDLRLISVPVPPLEEQRRIVADVEARLSALDALRASIERAQRRSRALRAAVLAQAFRGELVPQDPADERAEALLARIRAEREDR
jgi:type I restriction enzyme S subunit